MNSKISEAINLKYSPVAIILSNEKPEEGLQFKEGTWGCVASMLFASSKGKTAFFDRKTFGCIGGGTGLGFGNRYKDFPIDYFLSTGIKDIQTNIRTRTHSKKEKRISKLLNLQRNLLMHFR